MGEKKSLKSKLQSMAAESDNSRESETGYMDVGNPAQVHGKARAIRNSENGSHH